MTTKLETRRQPSAIAKWIRRMSIPIVLAWLALLVILNTVVPQLEEVGKAHQVSMSPMDAPSMQAMKNMGHLFGESDSDSVAMLVLEGDEPLGRDALEYYKGLVEKLRADPEHVQHVQDFWGDPLTETAAKSNDGKAAYTQLNLAGNMGETLSNESVEAVRAIVDESPPPAGVKVFVTGPAALQARYEPRGRPHHPEDHHRDLRGHHRDAAGLLPFRRHGRSPARHGRCPADGGARHRGVPRPPRDHRHVDIRREHVGLVDDRGGDRLRDLPHRPLSGGAHHRRDQGRGLLRDVPRHGACRAGLGPDHRRRHLLPHLHPHAVFPDPRRAVRRRHSGGCRRRPDARSGDHHHRRPIRPLRAKTLDAHPVLAADRHHDRAVARAGSGGRWRSPSSVWPRYPDTRRTTTTPSSSRRTSRPTRDSTRRTGTSPWPG